ncbi:MAG: hypothetical protein KDK70_13670 [Myxococcales bacterium]|nr:hypothetical protein [Myxococcales bacterium]
MSSSSPGDTPEAADEPGHDPGQSFDWGDYVAWLVENHGSLAAVAEALAAQRGHVEDQGSIERGLRRLRLRGGRDGGVWGRRALRAFGMPDDVDSRVRWMGQYHTRFSDLPRPLCLELLRPWDRPPISESPVRSWVQLGLAGVALRGRERVQAAEHLRQAERAAEGLSRLEWLLARAFWLGREGADEARALVDEAIALTESLRMSLDDRACYRARCVDHRGWHHNIIERDHESAAALYAALPAQGPPFARVRRDNGLGWSLLRLGRRDEAEACARRAIEAAGDGGSLRLRVMALGLLGATLDGVEAEAVRRRAATIAERLDDEILRVRVSRHSMGRGTGC